MPGFSGSSHPWDYRPAEGTRDWAPGWKQIGALEPIGPGQPDR